MVGNFNPARAAKAQIEYCDKHNVPMFAPANGICYRCGLNIYLPSNGAHGTRGVTVEDAAMRLITSCPHCNYSYVD